VEVVEVESGIAIPFSEHLSNRDVLELVIKEGPLVT